MCIHVFIHAYWVYISNLLIRYPRVCCSYHNFVDKRLVLRRIPSDYVDVITSRVFWSPQWSQNVCTTYYHRYLPFIIITTLFFLYSCHRISNKSYTMGVSSGTRIAYLSGTSELTPSFSGVYLSQEMLEDTKGVMKIHKSRKRINISDTLVSESYIILYCEKKCNM